MSEEKKEPETIELSTGNVDVLMIRLLVAIRDALKENTTQMVQLQMVVAQAAMDISGESKMQIDLPAQDD